MTAQLRLTTTRKHTLLHTSHQQSLQKLTHTPTLNVTELVTQQQNLVVLVELYRSHRKSLQMLSHRLSHVLPLVHHLVLVLTIPDSVKGQQAVDVHTHQTLVRI